MEIAFKILSLLYLCFLLWYLERIFIQQYYASKRFIKSLLEIGKNILTLSYKSIILLGLFIISFIVFFYQRIVAFIFLVALEILVLLIFPKAKKAWTRRSITLLSFEIVFILPLFFISIPVFFFVILFSPIWMSFYFLLVSYFTYPIESMIRQHYKRKAQNKLKSIPNLIIIAITGSYGKTSFKVILSQLLSLHYIVKASPKSVNTLMGLTKFINEEVSLNTEVLILECGVDEKRGMDRLLSLFTPDIAILTAVGKMHLSTFKSLDAIFYEKKKLLLKAKKGIYNLDNPYLLMHQNLLKNYQSYSGSDIFSSFLRTEEGLLVTFKDGNNCLIPLFGAFQLDNIAGAIKVADMLGVKEEEWKFILPSLKGADHRLIKKYVDNMIMFDDAYNGNEEGIIEGIKTILAFPYKKGIITPGVIELGEEYETVNKNLACYLKGFDYICIVSKEKKHPLYEEYKKLFGDISNIFYASSFIEGYARMKELGIEVLLVANDTFNTFLK